MLRPKNPSFSASLPLGFSAGNGRSFTMGELQLADGVRTQIRTLDAEIEYCRQIPHVGVAVSRTNLLEDPEKLLWFKIRDFDLVQRNKLRLTDLDLMQVLR